MKKFEKTYLNCINEKCGHKANLFTERKFFCPKCLSLYDVRHKFGKVNFSMLKQIFDERAKEPLFNKSGDPKNISGVWRFKELIMPYLQEEHIITLGEGNVPILLAGKNLSKWLGATIKGIRVWIMFEGMTPTGSFKDFGGTVLMSVAKAAGVKAIACASTGDTSAMAAAYAAAADIQCAVILPKGFVTDVQLAQPLVHGAKIIQLPGDFDDCMKVMRELVEKYGVYPANSLNPARIEGHQATVFLIAQFFGWEMPDWIAVPVGNGSNCSSVGKALRLLNWLKEKEEFYDSYLTKILGCQSAAANPLSASWAEMIKRPQFGDHESKEPFWNYTLWQNAFSPVKVGNTSATAARIGNPVSRGKVMREILLSNGAMETASEEDLNEAVSVCGKDGYFVCPQTGIALAGVRNAIKRKSIKKGEEIVIVSTATGLKFTESAARNLKDNIIDAKNCDPETVAKLMNL